MNFLLHLAPNLVLIGTAAALSIIVLGGWWYGGEGCDCGDEEGEQW